MRISNFWRHALSCCVAALFAACGGGSPSLSPSVAGPAAERTRPNVTYEMLLSFSGADGKYPEAGFTNVNNALYGMTYDGGPNNLGTVFTIAPSGAETLVYSFKGSPKDGALPEAGLLDVGGTLYGTSGGGTKGLGVVFKVTTSGHETLLHSFKGGSADGSFPVAGLVDVNGVLYGTTLHGGGTNCRIQGVESGCGTIFSITTSGVETVLHKFVGGANDGQYPEAGLVNLNGTLYGTTAFGGRSRCSVGGCGTVFAITPSGKETILHTFGRYGDGADPMAGLLVVNGALYGTTHGGGSYGWGTVFKITTSGRESVVYSFEGAKPGQDGADPVAGLINRNRTLYGTTYSGGMSCTESLGCGVVFAITTSGTETVLYRFKDHRADGAHPQAALINLGDALYGTTHFGGAGGYGTVFSLSL
jgi:uncharacterized repeat protein (TIGR03803 family)